MGKLLGVERRKRSLEAHQAPKKESVIRRGRLEKGPLCAIYALKTGRGRGKRTKTMGVHKKKAKISRGCQVKKNLGPSLPAKKRPLFL